MDPLDFLENDELLRFFHRSKTEMSCMEKPHTFLSRLRDFDLIPEDKYKKVTRMKSKENMRKAIYDILDWVERKHSKDIKRFWKCIFKDVILSEYPILKMLHKSLMDGSYHFETQLSEGTEKEKDSGLSEGEETENGCVKKKRKVRSESTNSDDNEQPGPSTPLTPRQRKKSKKIHFCSPLKKGEKGDIWTWPIYKSQLPVTCGDVEGTLKRDKLAKGEKCIVMKKQWLTPSEFERFAGKGSSKNWKLSIRCKDTPLATLIKEGHLKAPRYRRRNKKEKKPQPSSSRSTTAFEEEDEEEDEEDEDDTQEVLSNDRGSSTDDTGEEEADQAEQQPGSRVFKVTCRGLSGNLHKTRFATGRCGKCIRTETSWLTPEEFVKEAFCNVVGQTAASWRKDIEYDGNPLSDLLQKNVLKLHSLLCYCALCKPKPEDLDDQKNDDECCVCKSAGEENLVECDNCPRSFHLKCHIPHVEEMTIRDDRSWMCTFCVFKTTQACYIDKQKTEDVMSRQVSQHNMMLCQYLLLFLYSADEEQIFATDPSRYLSSYSSVIKTPMWLDSIAEKLQSNRYQTVGEFVSDVQLIFANSTKYNQNNAEFLDMGKHLNLLFDQEFKKAFNIQDESNEQS